MQRFVMQEAKKAEKRHQKHTFDPGLTVSVSTFQQSSFLCNVFSVHTCTCSVMVGAWHDMFVREKSSLG